MNVSLQSIMQRKFGNLERSMEGVIFLVISLSGQNTRFLSKIANALIQVVMILEHVEGLMPNNVARNWMVKASLSFINVRSISVFKGSCRLGPDLRGVPWNSLFAFCDTTLFGPAQYLILDARGFAKENRLSNESLLGRPVLSRTALSFFMKFSAMSFLRVLAIWTVDSFSWSCCFRCMRSPCMAHSWLHGSWYWWSNKCDDKWASFSETEFSNISGRTWSEIEWNTYNLIKLMNHTVLHSTAIAYM